MKTERGCKGNYVKYVKQKMSDGPAKMLTNMACVLVIACHLKMIGIKRT